MTAERVLTPTPAAYRWRWLALVALLLGEAMNRHPVVQDRLHPAVRGAADHRRPAGRHRGPQAVVRDRRPGLHERFAGLCPGARGKAADRLPCGAGRRGGRDHSADHRPDQDDVLGTRAVQGARRHRAGDGPRSRLRTPARRRPHPRRPVRLVLAGGLPGEHPGVPGRPPSRRIGRVRFAGAPARPARMRWPAPGSSSVAAESVRGTCCRPRTLRPCPPSRRSLSRDAADGSSGGLRPTCPGGPPTPACPPPVPPPPGPPRRSLPRSRPGGRAGRGGGGR